MPTQVALTGVTTYENVRIIDAIVDEGEAGIFINSALLVDQVLRDARIFSTLMTRILSLLGKSQKWEPSKAKGVRKDSAQRIADEVKDEWSSMAPHASLVELLVWGIMQGVGLAQVVQDQDPWRLEVWHPWALQWNEYERAYHVSTRENTLLVLKEDGAGGFVTDDGTRWVLFTPYGFANAGRRGLIRSLARLYAERQWAHRDRARYSEVHGQPMRVGVAPANSTTAEVDAFEDRLSPSGAEPVIVAKQGEEGNKWDVKLIEAMGKSHELFEGEIEQLDREIATLLLGQSQSTDGQAGLGSNDQAGEPVRLDYMRSDADGLSSCLMPQFVAPYCEFVYGSRDVAPYLCIEVEPPEDEGEKTSSDLRIGQSLVQFVQAGAPVDMRKYLESRGYGDVLMTPEEEAKMKADKAAEAAKAAEVAAQSKPQSMESPAQGKG